MSGLRATAQTVEMSIDMLRSIKQDIDSCNVIKEELTDAFYEIDGVAQWRDSVMAQQKMSIDRLKKDLRDVADHNDTLVEENFRFVTKIGKQRNTIKIVVGIGIITTAAGFIIK